MTTDRTTPYIKPKRVYVTNLGHHDYAPLEKYGDVIAITRGNLDFRNTDRIRNRVIEVLSDMEAEDYIALSGPNIIVTEVIAHVMARFGRVNYLYHESLYGDYLLRGTNGQSAGAESIGRDYLDDVTEVDRYIPVRDEDT